MSMTMIPRLRFTPPRLPAPPALSSRAISSTCPDSVEQLISSVTFPIFEQHLPASITGEHDPERALRKLRRLNGGVLVMTRAEQGSVALDGDAFHTAPAFNVKAVDVTGAGDVFRAGFIYGLLKKWAVPDVLRFANAAAALSCTRARRHAVSTHAC